MKIRIRCFEHDGVRPDLPKRATGGSAGADLQAVIPRPVTIEPGALVVIPTGIAIELPPGACAFIYARSGLGVRHGITLSNGVGVIDSDYRGEIGVGLCNVSDRPYTIQPRDRIAQLVVTRVEAPEYERAQDMDETPRGRGGFGSTGR